MTKAGYSSRLSDFLYSRAVVHAVVSGHMDSDSVNTMAHHEIEVADLLQNSAAMSKGDRRFAFCFQVQF